MLKELQNRDRQNRETYADRVDRLPNSVASLAALPEDRRTPIVIILLMLALRSGLSFVMLLGVAAVYAVSGSGEPFARSSAWWLWFVTVTNIASILLMAVCTRQEGRRLRDIFNPNRSTWKGDLAWLVGSFAVTAVIAQGPGIFLARLLWGTDVIPNTMLFGAIPPAAVYPLFLLMPITHAFAELPVYWGFVAPRLRAAGMKAWLVILIVGSVLSVQHLFFSFQPDWRYALWLALKFLPFALFTGFLIDRRPTLLPYMMACHLLLDSLLPVLTFMVSSGGSLY